MSMSTAEGERQRILVDSRLTMGVLRGRGRRCEVQVLHAKGEAGEKDEAERRG